jgi:hypothetical protein
LCKEIELVLKPKQSKVTTILSGYGLNDWTGAQMKGIANVPPPFAWGKSQGGDVPDSEGTPDWNGVMEIVRCNETQILF